MNTYEITNVVFENVETGERRTVSTRLSNFWEIISSLRLQHFNPIMSY